MSAGCGSGNFNNQCTDKPSCCAVCQKWSNAEACLGLSNNFLGVTQLSATEVKITYGNGDKVPDGTPRQVDIYISCDPEASILTFEDFVQSDQTNPPPPFYTYNLTLSSSILCDGSVRCYQKGYHFNYISAYTNWSHPWTPPGGNIPQTIQYAPCSTGIPSGCGKLGPPANQCTDKKDCCAVCQSWVDQAGNEGACLGLSDHLLGITAISNYGVQISYGGGDTVNGIERRVDVVIFCDPLADLLQFVDFITPVLQNPPPPFYQYVLVLTSSDLCGSPSNNLPEIMTKLKKYLPLY
jgi:hypothetical protein